MKRGGRTDLPSEVFATPQDAARRAFWWREGLMLGGFLLLVAAAVWTVALPELRKEPEGQDAPGTAAPGASAHEKAPTAAQP